MRPPPLPAQGKPLALSRPDGGSLLLFLREQKPLPDVIHSHYADAGYVGMQLSQLLGIPQIHTGHSLGRSKQQRLLAQGRKPQALEGASSVFIGASQLRNPYCSTPV